MISLPNALIDKHYLNESMKRGFFLHLYIEQEDVDF